MKVAPIAAELAKNGGWLTSADVNLSVGICQSKGRSREAAGDAPRVIGWNRKRL
jgi:hypothetical protein